MFTALPGGATTFSCAATKDNGIAVPSRLSARPCIRRERRIRFMMPNLLEPTTARHASEWSGRQLGLWATSYLIVAPRDSKTQGHIHTGKEQVLANAIVKSRDI